MLSQHNCQSVIYLCRALLGVPYGSLDTVIACVSLSDAVVSQIVFGDVLKFEAVSALNR